MSFTDTSTDADGSIVSWRWSFGDGATTTVQNPTHTYGAAGTYAVTLTVTDNDGASDSASETITVTDVTHASFTYDPALNIETSNSISN